jgi:hypothetical protein
VPLLALLLLVILFHACSSSWNPLDPVETPGGQNPPPVPPLQSPPDPAPIVRGDLEVSVTGEDALSFRGYRLIVQLDGSPRSQAWDFFEGTLRLSSMPRGTYSARLETPARDCPVQGANPRLVSVLAGQTSAVEFALSCPPVDPRPLVGVYERVDGVNSERYEIAEDGTFRLQFRFGGEELGGYGGTYLSYLGSSGPALLLDFSAFSMFPDDPFFPPDLGRAEATAVLRDDCLVVDYNTNMDLSDFADGEYCRS